MSLLDEICARTQKTRRWIFRHAKQLPFVKRVSRKTLIGDAELLKKWINRLQ